MEETNKKLVSLNELAKISDVYKSKLAYYVKLDLLHPIDTVGKMQIFSKKETLMILKKIERWQAKGKTLKEIKERLECKLN